MFEEVEFNATDGTTLRGRLYGEKASGKGSPIVIMTGGISATIDFSNHMAFAESIAAAGFMVLLYDHRNFGTSDGAIRQEVEPYLQVEDMRDAITFCQMMEGVDPERVGVWGSSFSGGHAIYLASIDRRIKCVSAQVPFISGSKTTARQVRPDLLAMTRQLWAADRLARMAGEAPMMMKTVTDNPMEPAAMPSADAWAFTMEHMNESTMWKNEITVRSMEKASTYEPAALIHMVSPTPLQMIIGTTDAVTTPDIAQEAYGRAYEPKNLVLLEGGHFDLYYNKFDEAVSLAIAWYKKYL